MMYSAVHGFWPVHFSNGRQGACLFCGDASCLVQRLLSATVSTVERVTPKFPANEHPSPKNKATYSSRRAKEW